MSGHQGCHETTETSDVRRVAGENQEAGRVGQESGKVDEKLHQFKFVSGYGCTVLVDSELMTT